MRLFNREIFTGSGTHSGAMLFEFQKIFNIAIANMGGLQQAGCGPQPMSSEEVEEIERQLEDNVRDLVMGLMHREVTFGPRMDWNAGGDNMPGWVAVIVDHEAKKVTKGYSCMGPGYGRKYVVLLPKDKVDDPIIQAELIVPKPKGFAPDSRPYERDYIRHLNVCYENGLCIQCGRHEMNDAWGEYMYPFCSLHDPYGKYYEDKLPEPDMVVVKNAENL